MCWLHGSLFSWHTPRAFYLWVFNAWWNYFPAYVFLSARELHTSISLLQSFYEGPPSSKFVCLILCFFELTVAVRWYYLTELFAWFCLFYLPASRPDISISLLHVPWRTSEPAAAGSSKLSQKPQRLGFLQCFILFIFSHFFILLSFFAYNLTFTDNKLF